MEIISHRSDVAPDGLLLNTIVEDEQISTYVVVAEPDLETVGRIVAPEIVEGGARIHAMAIESPEQAEERVGEVMGNVYPDDVAVFLCANDQAFGAALRALGYDSQAAARRLH